MVNRVLDLLEIQGRLRRPSAAISSLQQGTEGTVKLTKRQHILKELLVTERDYVHHLQNLQALKKGDDTRLRLRVVTTYNLPTKLLLLESTPPRRRLSPARISFILAKHATATAKTEKRYNNPNPVTDLWFGELPA